MDEVSTIGLDIAKSVFQVHGVDAAGARESPVLAQRDVLTPAGRDRWSPMQVSRLVSV